MKNKMRHFWLIAAFAVSAMIFTACDNDTTRDPVPPTITTGVNLGNFAVGQELVIPLAATGDTPITWALVEGQSLPPGLVLSPAGVISGTPTTQGTFTFSIRATNDADSVTQTFNMTIMLPTAPEITVSSPLNATINESFTYDVTIVDGTFPMTWSIIAGNPPTGISINQSGVIYGMPTEGGTFTFTVRAENDVSHYDVVVTMDVFAPVAPSIPPTGGTTISFGNALTYQVGGFTGTPTPDLTITGGDVPSGISLAANGQFSGTPTTAGTYTFTITASNGTLPNATQTFTLIINPLVTFDPASGEVTGHVSGFAGNIPSHINQVPVTIIAAGAFQGLGLTSVEIPAGVTTIETNAFRNNNLTNIVIPNSVTTIDDDAFYNNQLATVVIPDDVWIGFRSFAGAGNVASLESITMGTGVEVNGAAANASFGNTGFNAAFNGNGQAAGTYTRTLPLPGAPSHLDWSFTAP